MKVKMRHRITKIEIEDAQNIKKFSEKVNPLYTSHNLQKD